MIIGILQKWGLLWWDGIWNVMIITGVSAQTDPAEWGTNRISEGGSRLMGWPEIFLGYPAGGLRYGVSNNPYPTYLTISDQMLWRSPPHPSENVTIFTQSLASGQPCKSEKHFLQKLISPMLHEEYQGRYLKVIICRELRYLEGIILILGGYHPQRTWHEEGLKSTPSDPRYRGGRYWIRDNIGSYWSSILLDNAGLVGPVR